MVGFAELSHPNYKPTMGGRCIGCRRRFPQLVSIEGEAGGYRGVHHLNKIRLPNCTSTTTLSISQISQRASPKSAAFF